MMINAGLHSAHGIILDLEDSVAPEKKDEARILVRNALRQISFYGAERMVRINQGQRGLEDLDYVIPHNVNLILIPKCESPEDVKKTDKRISEIKQKCKLTNRVFLMPIIESALGVENSFVISGSSENVVAIAIGLEDFTADIGVPRTAEGSESLYARTRLVNAAKIERSKRIILAYEEAARKGLGVVALGSKMIDPPVVARAQKTIKLAIKLGLLSGSWMADPQTEQI